jgi:hypothetical protein
MSQTIPLTKGYVAIVDDEDYAAVSAFKWTALVAKRKARTVVYAYRRIGWDNANRRWKGQILLHRFIMGEPAGLDVDHRDGDGCNCQKNNLRVATRSQNLANNRRTVSVLGFRGITTYRGKIIAQMRGRHLGFFETAEAAARAYDLAAIEEFGEFARLNFPHEHGHAAPTAGNT